MCTYSEYKNTNMIFVSLGMETEANNSYLKKQRNSTSVFMSAKEKRTYIKIFTLSSLLQHQQILSFVLVLK